MVVLDSTGFPSIPGMVFAIPLAIVRAERFRTATHRFCLLASGPRWLVAFPAMIRPYRHSADLPALKRITATCFAGVSIDRNIEDKLGLLGGHDWTWRKLRHIDADVAGDNARHVFVWEAPQGEVAGYITGRVDCESRIGWIPNLAVDPAYQGQGIGRALILHLLEHFREQGMECAKIETLEQNAIGSTFYPDMGFEEVARQVHYVQRL